MMAKAHITVGMAAAFMITRPESVPEMLPVIAGASLGCLICDIDCENKTERTDSSRWRKAMAVVTAAALVEDHLLDAGIWRSIGQNGDYLWFAGIVGFVLSCTFASISAHRGFSHSLSAMLLETVSLWLVFPAIALSFAIAFGSHLILDLMNMKSVRLFYPAKKGFSLGWFHADGLANRLTASAGSIWLIAELISALRR